MKMNRKSGFTLVEIMIVVAIIGLLAAIAIPSFLNARTKSQQNACINNLRQIDGAIYQYKLDHNNTPPGTVGADLVPTYISRTPRCPASAATATYAIASPPVCPTPVAGHSLPP